MEEKILQILTSLNDEDIRYKDSCRFRLNWYTAIFFAVGKHKGIPDPGDVDKTTYCRTCIYNKVIKAHKLNLQPEEFLAIYLLDKGLRR